MGKIDCIKLNFLWNYVTGTVQNPIEGSAFTFLIVVSVLTYLNGTYVLLPELLEALEFPSVLVYLGYVVTTWIITGILANLFLIRYRNSSIVNRMLLLPKIETPTFDSFIRNSNPSPDDIIKEQTKSIGQHFMPKPFGLEGNWHICASCEVFVPPRAWHCFTCKTCVLRRDHHCIFAMACIGEENHSNFLGLLLYLAIGSSLATAVNIIYTLMLTDSPLWWFFVKAFIPFYTMIYDFSLLTILSSTNLLGVAISSVVFINYILMAFRSQTSIEADRSIGTSKYAYSNAVKFLGSNPVRRILWPFHTALKISYTPSENTETRKEL